MRLMRNALAILALTVLLGPVTANATAPDTARSVDRAVLIQKQLATLLQDGDQQQEQAIQLIAHYAHTDRYNDSFFYPLIDPLLEVVTTSEIEELRIMAISALSSIGNRTAMTTLKAHLPSIDSEYVETIARRALVQYTLEQSSTGPQRLSTRVPAAPQQ